MDNFEKVEKLVQKANVSYEDAKQALEEENGDMLDAMIALEKQGKVKKPETVSYSTYGAGQAANNYNDVNLAVERSENTDEKSFASDLGRGLKKFFRYTVNNSLKITRRGEQIFKIPLLLSLLLLLAAFPLAVVAIVISLFCECRYSIVGKNNSDNINQMFDKASDMAERAKEDVVE